MTPPGTRSGRAFSHFVRQSFRESLQKPAEGRTCLSLAVASCCGPIFSRRQLLLIRSFNTPWGDHSRAFRKLLFAFLSANRVGISFGCEPPPDPEAVKPCQMDPLRQRHICGEDAGARSRPRRAGGHQQQPWQDQRHPRRRCGGAPATVHAPVVSTTRQCTPVTTWGGWWSIPGSLN